MTDPGPRHIVVGVTGGIAAYKTADLVSRLVKEGYDVTVAMTAAATRFVGVTTFESLSGRGVLIDPWSPAEDHASVHVAIARRADLMIIAPCTMNAAARLAAGMADDAVLLIAAAIDRASTPVLLVPAMNEAMLGQPVTQRNLEQLSADGFTVIEPAIGWQACRTEGAGRMPEPVELLAAIETALN